MDDSKNWPEYKDARFTPCGSCDHWHRPEYLGDCRNDRERFSTSDLDDHYGVFQWDEDPRPPTPPPPRALPRLARAQDPANPDPAGVELPGRPVALLHQPGRHAGGAGPERDPAMTTKENRMFELWHDTGKHVTFVTRGTRREIQLAKAPGRKGVYRVYGPSGWDHDDQVSAR